MDFSSPRTRGYFHVNVIATSVARLFPAHAGVFPKSASVTSHGTPLPRARGGISHERSPSSRIPPSSPRTRGYFLPRPMRQASRRPFPAHAGVFPRAGGVCAAWASLPRVRGGTSHWCCLEPIPERIPTPHKRVRPRMDLTQHKGGLSDPPPNTRHTQFVDIPGVQRSMTWQTNSPQRLQMRHTTADVSQVCGVDVVIA